MSRERGLASTGWVVFAGITMVLTGLFNIFEGIIVLFNDDQTFFAVDRLVVLDLTGFGWTLIISGAIVAATGAGLMSARTWSRITAIIILSLHAVLQITWFAAYPVWSALMLGLDVAVLWAVTAGWSSVQEQLGDPGKAAFR